jgi:probable phosphoglycerate mutase
MRQLAREAAALVRTFPRVSFRHVPRELNAHADRLANAAMDAAARGEKWTRATASAGDVPPPTAVSSRDGAAGSGWLVADTAPTSMVLVRHAQTELTAERRFSGSGDPELTDVGVSESIAIADGLASSGREVSAVVTSPLRRARQTAEAIGQALGVQIDVDDGLRETDFGQWEGHTFAEVQAKWPSELEDWLTSPDVAPPGGESFAATARRVRRARDRLISAYGGQTLVVVTHVTPIKLLVRLALEAPPQALYRMHLDPASVSEIDWYADGPGLLRRLNDTSHLR